MLIVIHSLCDLSIHLFLIRILHLCIKNPEWKELDFKKESKRNISKMFLHLNVCTEKNSDAMRLMQQCYNDAALCNIAFSTRKLK